MSNVIFRGALEGTNIIINITLASSSSLSARTLVRGLDGVDKRRDCDCCLTFMSIIRISKDSRLQYSSILRLAEGKKFKGLSSARADDL
jgi:hypothetical protein